LQLEPGSEASSYERVEAGGSAVEMFYNQTNSLIDSSHIIDIAEYFFEPSRVVRNHYVNNIPLHNGATITAKIDSDTTAEIGKIALGLSADIGELQRGGVYGILDYSTKETDADNRVTLTQGAYADTATIDVKFDSGNEAAFTRKLQDMRATPCVWVGTESLTGTIIFGYAKEWKISYGDDSFSTMMLNIEGLG
jgi:hypothetical protein